VKRATRLTIAALGALSAACVSQPRAAMQAAPEEPSGFLSTAAIQALADTVAQPPGAETSVARADVAESERMRALEDSDRWTLATRHADLRPAIAISHFDCALGVRLTPETTPALVALLDRVLVDANAAAELAKARTYRPRPVAVDAERRACQVVSPAGRASASYPSGSAAAGAAYGEVFAILAPDRAEAARETGQQIGLSRMVCAMHYRSDVEAGAALGRAVFDAERADARFDAMAAPARAELDRARASGLISSACAAERLALSTPLP